MSITQEMVTERYQSTETLSKNFEACKYQQIVDANVMQSLNKGGWLLQ